MNDTQLELPLRLECGCYTMNGFGTRQPGFKSPLSHSLLGVTLSGLLHLCALVSSSAKDHEGSYFLIPPDGVSWGLSWGMERYAGLLTAHSGVGSLLGFNKVYVFGLCAQFLGHKAVKPLECSEQ